MRLTVHIPHITPRVHYVLHWLLQERLGLEYELVPKMQGEMVPVISYGTNTGQVSIPDAGLLSETTVRAQEIETGEWNGLPVLFYAPQDNPALPFDLFSAVFYLLSRYEEYLPFTPDKHQRYPAGESILSRLGLLERPVVDEWVHAFGKLLERQGIKVRYPAFRFRPTYDIDMAWLYRNKGLVRTIGGYIQDAASGGLTAVQQRTRVLMGKQADPYDSFSFIGPVAEKYEPLFFVLAAKENGAFDKHILPSHSAMNQLVFRLSQEYGMGIHPSYYSSERSSLMKEELALMQQISGKPILRSRQHYIRFRLPDTYRELVQAGIQEDYSMGYGTHLGFRAGTGNDFYWYDLEKETQSSLRVFPFCFMDTTAHFEVRLDVEDAFARLKKMQHIIKETGGLLITIFHNSSLGTAAEWNGWQERYRKWINEEIN